MRKQPGTLKFSRVPSHLIRILQGRQSSYFEQSHNALPRDDDDPCLTVTFHGNTGQPVPGCLHSGFCWN